MSAVGLCSLHYRRWIRRQPMERPYNTKSHCHSRIHKGYKEIRCPLSGRFVLEHRYVMAQHLGRPLRQAEHVHHIDGDRTNNALHNLQLVSNSEHAHLHRLHALGNTVNTKWSGMRCVACGLRPVKHSGVCAPCAGLCERRGIPACPEAAAEIRAHIARRPRREGSLCCNAKLNDEAVKVIRFLSGKGVSRSRLAAAYGVSMNTVSGIALRRSWAHVA